MEVLLGIHQCLHIQGVTSSRNKKIGVKSLSNFIKPFEPVESAASTIRKRF